MRHPCGRAAVLNRPHAPRARLARNRCHPVTYLDRETAAGPGRVQICAALTIAGKCTRPYWPQNNVKARQVSRSLRTTIVH